MYKIGFIVNPIAGMGGKVGLKGTDGKVEKAIELGAVPIAKDRAKEFLLTLGKILPKQDQIKLQFVVAPGKMGKNAVESHWPKHESISYPLEEKTTANDTINIAKLMLEQEIELLVFVGGDGTSNDVFKAVDKSIPILGVPSGVKIFGAVFAKTPSDAAYSLKHFITTQNIREAEVMDIDEDAYRAGNLSAELKGIALVPQAPNNMQSSKQGSPHTESEKSSQHAIANYVVEKYMQAKDLFILGPGSTVKAITDVLNLEKTPLGVDLLRNKQIIAKDVNETEILDYLSGDPPAKIIITPLGHQGSLFGRGNQQISAKVIKTVGKNNIIVVSTKTKLNSLEEKKLYIDTYNEDINEMLRGYIRVITDYKETTLVKIV